MHFIRLTAGAEKGARSVFVNLALVEDVDTDDFEGKPCRKIEYSHGASHRIFDPRSIAALDQHLIRLASVARNSLGITD